MARKAEVLLEFQNYIESPPVAPKQLYGQAASNDGVTIDHWRKTWIDNVRANKAKFGSFASQGLGKLFGEFKNRPVVIAGSGPSLKVNGHLLKDRGGLGLVSCLHNFHFFEDRDVAVDYYVTLDAGDITVEEVSEGGANPPEWYWERTKGRKLIAFIGSSPKLLEKWQGEIYFFNAPVPDPEYMKAVEEIEPFFTYVSNGGNVLGACLYISKGILGANPIVFVGADFAFGYDKKFHAWESKYDVNLGMVMKAVDVYGNKVLTWQSYANFKSWFDYVACVVPGIYINCTEGGTFGAYPDGNLMAIKQMELEAAIKMFDLSEVLRAQCERPGEKTQTILF